MSEHCWRLDDGRSPVTVEIDGGRTDSWPAVPTLTCQGCGMVLAWIPGDYGGIAAAFGVALDALVLRRPPKRCRPLVRPVEVSDAR